jgi:raffinose/stachyose/melibiose transport system substrate-binding protein
VGKAPRITRRLTLALCLLLALTGCAKKEAKTLTVWVPERGSYIGADEQKKAREEWYISRAFRRFEKANPGVTVVLVVVPDAAAAHQAFKAAAVAGNAPDVASLWSGQSTFDIRDAILPIDGLVPQADLADLAGWETMREEFLPGGRLLGYPGYALTLSFLFYNKGLVKQAGLDFEADPPRTTEEFDAALETIRKTGVVPIATDESFPWFNLRVAVYWWYQISGPDRILKDCLGEEKFSEDKGLLSMLDNYSSQWKRGDVNGNAATSRDSWANFLQGKAALTPQVSTMMNDAIAALGSDNVGILAPPDMDTNAPYATGGVIGGATGALVVSKGSKNPDLAVKLLSFLNSRAETLELLKSQSFVPVRRDIAAVDAGLAPASVQEQMFSYRDTLVSFIDTILTPGVLDEYRTLCPLVLVGTMTPMQFALALDAKAAELKK